MVRKSKCRPRIRRIIRSGDCKGGKTVKKIKINESIDKYVFEFKWKSGREGFSGYNDFTCTGFIERIDIGNGVSIGRLSYTEFGFCDEDYDPTEAIGEAMQDVYSRKALPVQLPDFGKSNSR